MADYQIFTDATADLTAKMVEGLPSVKVIPMQVEIGGKEYTYNCPIELNEVNILLKIVKESSLATILSEATIYSEPDLVAIRIDAPGTDMEGCVHVLKDSYRKCSALKFVKLLCESDSIREKAFNWLKGSIS